MKNHQAPQQFRIGQSRNLQICNTALHVLAIAACWLNALPALLKLGLSLLVLMAYVFSPKPAVPLSLQHSDRQGWRIAFPDQEPQTITLLASSVVSRWLTILHFQIDQRKMQTLIVFNDALPSNDYRRLTVRLKQSSSMR